MQETYEKTIQIQITFLEPYRLVEWRSGEMRNAEKKRLRGQSFARWVKSKNGGGGKPSIPGTLLRSATIKAAEELISLLGGKWNGSDCCNGKFLTETACIPKDTFDKFLADFPGARDILQPLPLARLTHDQKASLDKIHAYKELKKYEKPSLLRKRHTLQWESAKGICNDAKDACPLCILLGRFDKAGKNHNDTDNRIENTDYHIHFSNLYPGKEVKTSVALEDIATQRTLNRVDYTTGKAHDYFKLWEVDDDNAQTFTGKITIRVAHPAAEGLLTDALGFVDRLCGSLCTVEIKEKPRPEDRPQDTHSPSHSPKKTAPHGETTASTSPGIPHEKVAVATIPAGKAKEVEKTPSEEIRKNLKDGAEKITQAFQAPHKRDANNLEKLRSFADVVRAMRAKTPEILDKLPTGKDAKNHHLWDIDVGGKPLRAFLKDLYKPPGDWRTFCTSLGNELYFQYKKATGGLSSQYRILGETEYYPEGDDGKKEHGIGGSIPLTSYSQRVCEWIFVGDLKAATPFYFGVQPSSVSDRDGIDKKEETGKEKNEGADLEVSDQTSFRILLDKKGHYRIPRSLLRGVLRRDLRTAFGGSACNVELGGMKPCACKVCAIMQRITIRDAKSDYAEPPDIRYRIRLNPYTATVDEGALFDMEVGPEGITFPLVLRYRGAYLPNELAGVLHLWADGVAWLGGSGSTGKGRFQLIDVEVFEWNLNEGIQGYIKEKGRRGEEAEIATKAYPKGMMPINLPDKNTLEPYREYLNLLWTKVTYRIEISSPLISADTIHALLDENNRDAIMYEKRVMCGNTGEPKTIPTIKGETIRGIIRTAVGKRRGGLDIDDHEDCPCRLCAIFGNEHEAGKVRFEDLTPLPVGSDQGQRGQAVVASGCSPVQSAPPADAEIRQKYKHIDHVAIDRFHGGAADAMKFDTYALAGSPKKPIVLAGVLWIKKDILAEYGKAIADALADVRNGLYPIGGKTGVGYGWVSGLKIVEAPATFKQLMPAEKSVSTTEEPRPSPAQKHAYPYKGEHLPKLEIEPGNIYYPHYFLKPANTVNREQKMIGHEKFHGEYTAGDGKKENLVSGKITCKLTTITPLIIPDTGDEKGLDNNDTRNCTPAAEEIMNAGKTTTGQVHKSYKFFRIHDDVMIPGSEIRGMISSVYEAITNSCFRIFDESRYVTRRLSPEQNKVNNARCGIIRKNDTGFSIIEVENYTITTKKGKKLVHKVYRLPLYDNETVTNAIDFDRYKGRDTTRNEKIQDAIAWNNKIADVAKTNCAFLKSLSAPELEKVIQGEKCVKFDLEKGKNPNDYLAKLSNTGSETGYVKFTGLNMVNIKNVKDADRDFSTTWDSEKLNVFHNKCEERNSRDHKYPRPVLNFVKSGVEYNIPKRCERIFCIPLKNGNKYEVSPKVCKQYKDVLSDYEKNFGHIDKTFTTKVRHKELTDGDLVYFIPDTDNKTVKSVMPVPLSRITDSKTLGERLPHDKLSPCVHEVNEGLISNLPDFIDKNLFSIHPDGLCPACRLFGTTHYKGRVRFGFANLVNKPNWLVGGEGVSGGCVTLPLLERPRPTWSIPSDEYGVPGRKFYVHHNGWRDMKDNPNKNNRIVEPLDAGNEFTFDVHFENLREWELGLLLYSLELQPNKTDKTGMAHKLGMGKPLGFGSVKVGVMRLLTFTPGNPTTTLDTNSPTQSEANQNTPASEWRSEENHIEDYVKEGFAKLKGWFGKEWNEIEHIKDIQLLLQLPISEEVVKYPKLNEKAEDATPGYTYEKLKETLSFDNRVKNLMEPWSTWFPCQQNKAPEQENKKADPRKPGESVPKTKPYPVKKDEGTIKSFDVTKDIITITRKDNHVDITAAISSLSDKNWLKKGQKVTFTSKGLLTAENVEMAK